MSCKTTRILSTFPSVPSPAELLQIARESPAGNESGEF